MHAACTCDGNPTNVATKFLPITSHSMTTPITLHAQCSHKCFEVNQHHLGLSVILFPVYIFSLYNSSTY